MKRAALALLLLAAGPAAAEPLDIAWFKKNPEQRENWLRRCQGDARFYGRNIDVCRNAQAADASTLGRPLRGPPPPLFPSFQRSVPNARAT